MCFIKEDKNVPPKAKFTKAEIVNAALEIARQDGMDALTARNLGSKLGSSSRPIFTMFKNMEEVEQETIKAAKAVYKRYVKQGIIEAKAFMGVGKAYIRFSKEEPKLFCLLFMSENETPPAPSEVLYTIDENNKEILEAIKGDYALEDEDAKKLYQYLWIFTHGIAALCATKVSYFSEAEISEMLGEVGKSILQKMKVGKNNGKN